MNKKAITILVIYILFLVGIPIIKNKTRIIEKNILNYESKISVLKKNLLEAQLEYYYLSSPEVLTKKIHEYSDTNYTNMEFSQIYFNLEHFKSEQKKISKMLINEKNKK